MFAQEDVDMEERDDESFSNSAEGSSEDEDMDEERIKSLKQQVEASPYTYDLHIELISVCRKLANLDELRAARENMAKLFPLAPEIWLDWLTDEQKLATMEEEKENLIELFERSLKDYVSVSVWLEYVQFSIGNIGKTWTEEGVKKVREIFERALTAVGIHVTQGSLIWEAYKEFEKAYLFSLGSKESDNKDEEIKQQEGRIKDIFKRQLSVPLVGMDKTYQEYKEYFEGKIEAYINSSYEKAMQKLKTVQKYEDALFLSEPPHYEDYIDYIRYEEKSGDPIRIQQVYERALIENCLKDELWDQYTKYFDKKVKISTISVPAHERAVRNCPWSVKLWVNYVRALERYEEPHAKVVEIFETALNVGISKAEDFEELWLAYLDYLRRRLKDDDNEKSDLDAVSSVLERAAEQMETYFKGTQSHYVILKYWAFFELKHKNNIDQARKLWEDALNYCDKEQLLMWLDYASFERVHGDVINCKRVLLRALGIMSSWQDIIAKMLITYEREEGTLESFEKMVEKCEAQMQKANEKRKKIEEEMEVLQKQKQDAKKLRKHVAAKKNQMKSKVTRPEKNSRPEPDVPVQMDSEGFKIPPIPDRVVFVADGKSEILRNCLLNKNKRPAPEETVEEKEEKEKEKETPELKKQKVETSTSHGVTVQHDPSKDDRTVFLSNLSYKLEEDKIKEFFSEVAEVEEIRLVRDFKGRSKGFCYVVYTSEEDAKKALQKDRQMLEGRPVLVSPCEDKKRASSPQQKFKFKTGLEKNKLFIKNLPFDTTKEDLENMFKEHGIIKDVRLVTYRNGHSKGLAYVEYEDEASASQAVVRMDNTEVGGHVISVAISNPPPRRPKKETSGVTVSDSLGGGTPKKGPRGRGRTQISLLPRSVLRPQAAKRPSAAAGMQNGQGASTSTAEKKQLSNSDFAKMLLKN